MKSPWLSFVPRHVAREILAHPGADLIGREQRFDAVALFADVAGFTAMSEALGAAGRLATEELTTILNSYFGPMIELVESYGGIVGKFGGDALTVLFPYRRKTQPATVRRAIQCALDMQAAMRGYEAIGTSAGVFNLAMKAGLAMGRLLCTTIGDRAVRLEYVIAGGALDRCADAEHHAARGEIVIDNALLGFLDGARVAETRGAFSCIAGLNRRARRAPLQPLADAIPESAIDTLTRFVHPSIAQRFRLDQRGLVNEHRKVSILFARFDGFDYENDRQASARLQAYLSEVVRIIHQYGGYLNKVDMGDKGSKYLALFGAPVAHENDEERAVRCALDLLALPLPGGPARIGVHAGFVYCGLAGSDARQEYTVIGDAVNLASRLMQAAGAGQILVSGSTQRTVGTRFVWEALAPIPVKGKSEPVEIFAAREVREPAASPLQEPSYALPMVGRERELRLAQDAIRRAGAGQGRLIGITAEAGMGKSRLAAEIVRSALAEGFVVYGGACHSYGTQTSYLVWRDIWRSFFGLSPSLAPEAQAQHLANLVSAIDPRLLQRLPLLGAVLNVALPDNDFTRLLDAPLRADLLKSMLLDCLRHRARTTPLALVLEDGHWIDPLSQDLLAYIGRNVADLPVLLLVLYRPAEGEDDPLGWAAQSAHYSEIRLSELLPMQAAELARLKLKQLWGIDGEPPLGLITSIMARTQGNPFFLEEIINYIHDRGLDPRDEAALASLDIPDSLHNLIISRIDQLAEAPKTTLKVASVIGRLFRASWIWGSYPQAGAPGEVKRHLQDLSRLDLTPLNKPEPELEYLFKHITTQEVAYGSLALATRAVLHECIGQFIERHYAGALGEYVDVLAHHYGRSANTEKQRVYFRRAGDAAKSVYANEAAIDYYQRLLPLLPEPEQGDALLALGETWQLIGEWGKAEEAYRQALSQANGDIRLQARAQTALGALLSRTESFETALEWLSQAQAGFEQLGDRRGAGQVLEQLSFAYSHLGDTARALACAEQQLAIATEHADPIGISAALDTMGIAYFQQGEYDRALASLQQSRDVAVAHNHKRGVVVAYNDLAGVYWQRGDYPKSMARLLQALEVASEIGYQQMVGLTLGNAGSIYKQLNETDRALTCYAQALRIAVELGDGPGVLICISNVASLFAAQGRDAEAGAVFARAIDLARSLNIPDVLCANLHELARLRRRAHRLEEAVALNQEALEVAQQIESKEVQFQAQVLAIRLRADGREIDAQAAIAELESLLEAWPGEVERALVYYEIWRLDAARADAQKASAELYQSLYAATSDAEYRRRHDELTGEQLSEPPLLPSLPEELLRTPATLETMLERVGVALAHSH